MKTLSVKVSNTLDARLALMAQRRAMSKSAVIRDALEAYLKRDGRGGAGSALDQAKDLAGCLAGPGDLSFNKKYLKDFGR
jgi:Arc/MetJ-type ribon-helix-helix transcriptional regulator